jgi:hypothetical protein
VYQFLRDNHKHILRENDRNSYKTSVLVNFMKRVDINSQLLGFRQTISSHSMDDMVRIDPNDLAQWVEQQKSK